MLPTTLTWPYELRRGHSEDPSGGACAMDAVNWLVHGKHGDEPECACPVIGAYVMSGNDVLAHEPRQRLLSYLPRISGSKSLISQEARAKAMWIGMIRTSISRIAEKYGNKNDAHLLRNLPNDANAATATATKAAALSRINTELVSLLECRILNNIRCAISCWTNGDYVICARWSVHPILQHPDDIEDYFAILDAALNAGPQGAPWSADAVDAGARRHVDAGGLVAV